MLKCIIKQCLYKLINFSNLLIIMYCHIFTKHNNNKTLFSSYPIHNFSHCMLRYFVVVLLIASITADCPVSSYPRRTSTGTIKAELNNDPTLHNKQIQFTYPVPLDFIVSQVKFAISLLNIQAKIKDNVQFKIQPKTSVGIQTFKFLLFVNESSNGWRSITFAFFASQSELFQMQVLTTTEFSGGVANNRYALYRPTPRYTDFQVQPAIKVYLAGYTLRSRPTSQSTLSMQSLLQFRKKLQSDSAIVTSLTQSLQLQKSLSLNLLQPKLLGKFYSLTLQSQSQLTSLTYSILIYSKSTLRKKYNTISSSFTLVSNNDNRYTPLTNTDMILYGVTSLKFPKDQYYTFSLETTNIGGQFSSKVLTNLPHFDVSYTYFGIQTKNQYICEECVNSPILYNDRFCVGSCPRGYSVSSINGIKICDKCDIEKLKVNDPETGLCVCAKRHYYDSATDTCKPCRYDCLTCNSGSQCLTCDNSLMQIKRKLVTKGKCECSELGYFDDARAENIVCQKCHSKCRTCNGPRAFDCLTCEQDKQLDSNRFCVCKNNFIEDPSGNCICPPPRTLSQSNTCNDNETLCGPNKDLKSVSGTLRCVCKAEFIQISDECIKCSPNSEFNKDTLKCECTNNTIQVNGRCIKCGPNEEFDPVYKICVCANGTFKKDDGSCITCPSKMVLINDQCQCVFNYYQSGGLCKPCLSQRDGPKCKRNFN